jgi:hypothetical protein
MMNFIKTVATTNGNYAVFFQEENTGYMAGVYLNCDGYLIRPMSYNEAKYCWKQWASDAKSVVPKFHIPFLTIGRELERFYWEFPLNGEQFSTVSDVQKWVEKSDCELLNTERYESISFWNKTIQAMCMEYCSKKKYEESLQNEDFSDLQIQFYFFNIIS